MMDIISKLPDDILSIIFNFINIKSKIHLNKQYYLKYNYIIYKNMLKNNEQSYIRSVIRNDYRFIFNNILNYYFSDWIIYNNFFYKNICYENYISFLLNLSKNYNSNKCYQIIIDKLYINGFNNKFKTKKINKNKWMA